MAKPQRGLGRGFDSLIPTELEQTVAESVGVPSSSHAMRDVDLLAIVPNPHQPRRHFDQAELQGLADSIAAHGILHPPVVSDTGNGVYELIAGERRVRAAKLAGLQQVPVIVRSFDEQQKLELALLENVQRSQLNPVEAAVAYKKLADEFNLTLDQIGSRMGKAKSTVANTIRLLHLPSAARNAVMKGEITEAHARSILALDDATQQDTLLKNIINDGWTVRQAEEYVRTQRDQVEAPDSNDVPVRHGRPMQIRETPETTRLSQTLATKVSLSQKGIGGKLVIEYKSAEDLQRIVDSILE